MRELYTAVSIDGSGCGSIVFVRQVLNNFLAGLRFFGAGVGQVLVEFLHGEFRFFSLGTDVCNAPYGEKYTMKNNHVSFRPRCRRRMC